MELGKNRDTERAKVGLDPKHKEVKRLQMNFPPELHKAFKTECFIQDREMTDVIKELVIGWMIDNGRGEGLDKFMPDK